ncbi:MAG: NAD(P)H-dependent oxidoreductase subunit E [Spirochaetes bacterium]|jgi:[NiFe] hydrogenase diaphorase moiety large subunit|nr:NAD(P)H-dependent oxidoreductase subunit E [Spirochaetota bacterium]
MSNTATVVESIIKKHNEDAGNLIDMIRDVQSEIGQVSKDAIVQIAERLNISAVDVEGVVTFYHFFTKEPAGKYTVYLNNSAVSVMMGQPKIAKAFEFEAECKFGSVNKDGNIGLYNTSCIGMNDQEPAAIINGIIFTGLTPEKVKSIVAGMKAGKDIGKLVKEYGDGKNQSELVKAMVNNNIRKTGAVLLAPYKSGSALKKAVSMKPEEVIEEIKISNLRGRGGAGFPTGMKWEFTRKNSKGKCYILCNADEGEPGTFKDRVILTEIPEMLFEGMAVGGYAIGAEEGVIYLRAEYIYLKDYLENVLKNMRKKNLLGKNIEGKNGFNFDITIKIGAGAYVCGEESALIESAEGKRGEPRNRPPFPAQHGYLGYPTSVNNVESFCAAARIISESGEWYTKMGTAQSKGTKLLSVSGDCKKPGIYEVEFGTTVQTLIEEADAKDAVAIQIGGPSGTCISRKEFSRRICYDDLATGGSIIIIGPDRDLLQIVHNFMDFFIEESCGWCVPCRAGNVVLKHKLEKIMNGFASEPDIKEIEAWGKIIKCSSRCGLGQTSPNPILTTIKNFREIYESRLQKGADFVSEFDLAASVKESCKAAGRKPNLQGH